MKNWFHHPDGGSFGFTFKDPKYDGVEVYVSMSRVQRDFRGSNFRALSNNQPNMLATTSLTDLILTILSTCQG